MYYSLLHKELRAGDKGSSVCVILRCAMFANGSCTARLPTYFLTSADMMTLTTNHPRSVVMETEITEVLSVR